MISPSLALLLPALLPSPLLGGDPVEESKVRASDGEATDRFGWDLALDGDRMLVGAPGNSPHGLLSGTAYVFDRVGTLWNEAQILIPPDGGPVHTFGDAVALEGDRALVGALRADGVLRVTGAAYVWSLVGGVWQVEEKLAAPDGHRDAHFGDSVAMHGNLAVVGATGDNEGGVRAGAAYVFERVGSDWVFQTKLTASAALAGDEMGYSIAVYGERVLVGVRGASDHGEESGAVLVFARNAGVWSEEARLTSSAAHAFAFFGESVAFDGERAVIGAPQCPTCQVPGGWASVFRLAGGSWQEEQVLTSVSGHDYDRFGDSVDVEGDTIVIGASLDDSADEGAGALVVWRLCAGQWRETGRAVSHDAFAFDEFAHSVSLSGELIASGVWRDDDLGSFSGSSYLFRRIDVEPVRPYCFGEAGACPCSNEDDTAGCSTSSGSGALLAQAGGSTSVAADDLVISASGLPPGATGLLFMAGGQARLPLGDGNLCVVPGMVGLRRFALTTADSAGLVLEGPGLAAYSRDHFPRSDQIRACLGLNFQFWFRDPMGPCGSGSNLTNALHVDFD